MVTPYSDRANGNRRDFMRGRCRPVRGEKRGDFHWEFDHRQQRNLLAWLARNWGGQQGLALADEDAGTPARVFDIPTWKDFTAANQQDARGNWQRKP